MREMNEGSISSSHLTLSGASSSSKTVVAILQQARNKQSAEDLTRIQPQQLQAHSKKIIQGADQYSNKLNQFHLSTTSSLNHVTLPSTDISTSCIRNVSPVAKSRSSLNYDLSSSCITAQFTKDMVDLNSTPGVPNLLRSALQGNMPDPMGVHNSKTEDSVVTLVAHTSGSLSNYNSQNRKAPARSNIISSSNNMSDPLFQGITFRKILTPITGSGGYLIEEDIFKMDSRSSTVENLLASTDGAIQTVNVSHIPKPISDSEKIGSLPVGASSLQSTAARPSQFSAMEIAHQIQVEANGQKSSAHLAALRPGLQQQLRSQIQNSISINANRSPQLTSMAFSKEQSIFQRTSPKEVDKIPGTAMPLPASKLSTFAVTHSAGSSVPTELGHRQQPTKESSMPSTSLAVSVTSSPYNSFMAKELSQDFTPAKPATELLMHEQNQHNDKNQWLLINMSEAAEYCSEPVVSHNHLEIHEQSEQQVHTDFQSAMMNHSGLYSGPDSQQTLEGLIQGTNMNSDFTERTSLTDMPARTESHSQKMTRHLHPHDFYKKSSMESSLMPSFQSIIGDINQGFTNNHNVMPHWSGEQTLHNTSSDLLSHTFVMEDLNLDNRQLASITSDGTSQQISSPTNNTEDGWDNSGLHSTLDGQSCDTLTSTISDSADKQRNVEPLNSQIFSPVRTVPSFTQPSLQTTSSMSYNHIPRSIMCASASTLSSVSSENSSVLSSAPHPLLSERLRQQYDSVQQYHQIFPTNSHQAEKLMVQNPFTFQTSNVEGHTNTFTDELIPFAFTTAYDNFSDNTDRIPQDLHGQTKGEIFSLSKCQPNVSVTGSEHREACSSHRDMPGLLLDVCNKQENCGTIQSQDLTEEITMSLVQPFNQRMSNLSCFPVMNSTYRATYKSHVLAVQRARLGLITDASKSLDILRQNLQHNINKEITDIIKKYIDKFFQPAIENIKQNRGHLVGEEYIQSVCRQILEEAKTLYVPDSGRRSVTLTDISDDLSESGSHGGRRVVLKRRRFSDSDSEKGSDSGLKRKVIQKKVKPVYQGGGRVTPLKTFKSGEPVKREGPKWDPVRLKTDTLFVMGARANKALGLGNTRGRLYIRHPDVFKYIGDQEDKLWLSEHGLMPATGGKAYMLLLEDIEDLSRSDEYRNSPGLMMRECVSFIVPEWMLVKMKEQMKSLRSNKSGPSESPSSGVGELSSPKELPFLSFVESTVKTETMPSPSDADQMDFLSAANNDDTHPSSTILPFTIKPEFEDGVSNLLSDLDNIEDPQPDTNFMS